MLKTILKSLFVIFQVIILYALLGFYFLNGEYYDHHPGLRTRDFLVGSFVFSLYLLISSFVAKKISSKIFNNQEQTQTTGPNFPPLWFFLAFIWTIIIFVYIVKFSTNFYYHLTL